MQSLEIVLHLTPYYGPGLGRFIWSGNIGGCSPVVGKSNVDVLVVSSVHLSFVVIINAITSLWTFHFTYCFLKKTLRRHETNLNLENFDVQKSLCTKRVKNLIGIFTRARKRAG